MKLLEIQSSPIGAVQLGVMGAQSKTSVSLAPPFTIESAILKVRVVEDNWNSRNAEQVARGYAEDCYWRNRAEFLNGRGAVIAF